MAHRKPPTGPKKTVPNMFAKGKLAEHTVAAAHPPHGRGAKDAHVPGYKAKAVEPKGGAHGHGLKKKK